MIGNRVRELRQARGESVRRLAAAVGMDPTNLSRLEAGRRGTSDAMKLKIAEHFELSVADVFFQPMGVSGAEPPIGPGVPRRGLPSEDCWGTARVPHIQEARADA